MKSHRLRMFLITSSIGPQNVPPLIELVFIFSGLVSVSQQMSSRNDYVVCFDKEPMEETGRFIGSRAFDQPSGSK
jgi:hypothetical protein